VLRSDSGALAGLSYFKQAIALDSTYAGAYAGLARLHLRTSENDATLEGKKRAIELARLAAQRALVLDDSLAEAHAAVGLVGLQNYDFTTAEREMRYAIALDPANSRFHEWMSFIHIWNRREAESLAEARLAVDIDPLSPSANAEVGRSFCAIGRYSEGLAELKKLESIKPPLLRVATYTSLCHGMRGDWDAAAAIVQSKDDPLSLMLRGYFLARGGRTLESQRIREQFVDRWKRSGRGAQAIAVQYAGVGQLDSAFIWLDRAVDDHTVSFYVMMPLFKDLRADPRFARFEMRLRSQKR